MVDLYNLLNFGVPNFIYNYYQNGYVPHQAYLLPFSLTLHASRFGIPLFEQNTLLPTALADLFEAS
jgi:hypothetical protein